MPRVLGSRRLLAAYNGLLATHVGYAVFGRALPATLFGLIVSAKASLLRDFLATRFEREGLGVLSFYAIAGYQSLVVMFLALVCLLFVVRRPITRGLTSIRLGLLAIGGTFASTPLAFAPIAFPDPVLMLVAGCLMVAGTLLAIVALLHLGRCFGVSPQARGLVTSGPYRWLRHPVYVGEQIATLGVLLPVLSPPTLAVFLFQCSLQFGRARAEEAVLTSAFPQYASYRRQVARFLPGVY